MPRGSVRLRVTVDSFYHRHQLDDWLAGGEIQYRGQTYHWAAQDSNYGFGWEIEPVTDEDWADVSDSEFDVIATLIEKCLREHRTAYTF